jgi:predicted DNA-binding antitoxin AbrB/MazE fold protein
MARTFEAVYEGGVLKPLKDPGLDEHQRVVVELRLELPMDDGQQQLRAWQSVYEGLSEADIDEVEDIALDRSRFMKPASDD